MERTLNKKGQLFYPEYNRILTVESFWGSTHIEYPTLKDAIENNPTGCEMYVNNKEFGGTDKLKDCILFELFYYKATKRHFVISDNNIVNDYEKAKMLSELMKCDISDIKRSNFHIPGKIVILLMDYSNDNQLPIENAIVVENSQEFHEKYLIG